LVRRFRPEWRWFFSLGGGRIAVVTGQHSVWQYSVFFDGTEGESRCVLRAASLHVPELDLYLVQGVVDTSVELDRQVGKGCRAT
jgi:hypothetical protein